MPVPQSFIIFFLPGLMLVNAAIVKSHATGLVASNSELSLQGCVHRPRLPPAAASAQPLTTNQCCRPVVTSLLTRMMHISFC